MEWKYLGKFRDRSPSIRAAGASLKASDTLNSCLHVYPIDDAIETVLREAGLHKVPLQLPPPRMENTRHVGIYTGVRAAVSLPSETRYQTLLNDLRETTWASYWTKELAKATDPIGNLPTDKYKTDCIFGAPPRKDSPTGEELLNPRDITPYELVFNEAEYHEMYKKTHGDYFPGEQLSRNYDASFNPGQTFGSRPKTKKKWNFTERTDGETCTTANRILADHLDKFHPKIGKISAPNKNEDNLEIGHRFGRKSVRAFHSLADIVQSSQNISRNPSEKLFQRDFQSWLKTLNGVRMLYCKRKVNFYELLGFCKYADVGDMKHLNLNAFEKILRDAHLSYPRNDILAIAEILGIYKQSNTEGNVVEYEKMLDLLNLKVKLPPIGHILTSGSNSDKFITNSMVESCFVQYKDNSNDVPAGERVQRLMLLADRENLGHETNVAALINPCVYTNYVLSHADLLAPRKPEYMKRLFTRLGFQFFGDTFEQLWEIGVKVENNKDSLVSVDTFKVIMERAAPITINPEKEDACFREPAKEHCKFN